MTRRRSSATPVPFLALIQRIAPRVRAKLGAQVREGLRLSGRSLVLLAVGAVMLAMIGLLVANLVNQVMLSARLEDDIAAAALTVTALSDANTTLDAAVAFAESDVNVEQIAREQLGYAREGDMVLLPLIPTAVPPAPTPTAAPAAADPAQPANWQRWWEALFLVQS